MLAVVLEDWVMVKHDYPKPVPRVGEALVKVLKAGICKTDLEVIRGYKGFRGVLGHEFVGLVEHHPNPLWEGKRVVGEINIACGTCSSCQARMPNHCLYREVIGIYKHNGVFAEYVALPARNLHLVPPALSDEVAVFTEPLAAALEILEQVHIRPTDRVVILGDGKLGLLCAQVLALASCRVTIIGHHENKLKLAQGWGITTLRRVSNEETLPVHFMGAEVVIDCTGSSEGINTALQMVRPRGTVVLKSTYRSDLTVNMSDAVANEVTLVGSRCGPFPPALNLLAGGKVKVLPLIHATYPLAEAIKAFDKSQEVEALKVLLEVSKPQSL